MITFSEIRDALNECSYPGFGFHVGTEDGGDVPPYLQVVCADGVDNVTGQPSSWRGRKWRLSWYMTKSEVVQTAFFAVMTAIEHEARERFTYRGRAIFQPHWNVDVLANLMAITPVDARKAG